MGAAVKKSGRKLLKRKLDVPPSIGENQRLQLPRQPNKAPSTASHMDWQAHQRYVHRLFDDSKDDDEPIPLGGEQKMHFLLSSLGHATDEHIVDAIDDTDRRIPSPLASRSRNRSLKEMYAASRRS